jgi:hypothetical protein
MTKPKSSPRKGKVGLPQIKTPGKLIDKKLAEIRDGILDDLINRGFIDDDMGLRIDIGDLINENIDHELSKP